MATLGEHRHESKKMKPKLNKITEVLRLESTQPEIIYGFDRITLWLDIPQLPVSEAKLKEHCANVKVTVMQMPHNARWKLKLALFQPTQQCLRLLKKALGHDIAVLVSYVEIAFDVPASSANKARLIRNFFLSSAKMPYQRDPVRLDERGNIFYFGQRSKKEGEKWVRSAHVLATYSDQPSKLLNAQPKDGWTPCAHIEHRASGSAAIADIGIVAIDDLIGFDHATFWKGHVQLYQWPLQKVIGYQLANIAGANLNVSDVAFRKRAANWESDHSIEDAFGSNFILANALLDAPDLCKAFKKISFSKWLDEVDWL